jgi:hypothetical protein
VINPDIDITTSDITDRDNANLAMSRGSIKLPSTTQATRVA